MDTISRFNHFSSALRTVKMTLFRIFSFISKGRLPSWKKIRKIREYEIRDFQKCLENEIRRNTKCFVFRIPFQEIRRQIEKNLSPIFFSSGWKKSRISYSRVFRIFFPRWKTTLSDQKQNRNRNRKQWNYWRIVWYVTHCYIIQNKYHRRLFPVYFNSIASSTRTERKRKTEYSGRSRST